MAGVEEWLRSRPLSKGFKSLAGQMKNVEKIIHIVGNLLIILISLIIIFRFIIDYQPEILLLIFVCFLMGFYLGETAVKYGLKRAGEINPFECNTAEEYINCIKESALYRK